MMAIRLENEERIVVDGIMDEGVWQRAEPATDFTQQDPDFGGEKRQIRTGCQRQTSAESVAADRSYLADFKAGHVIGDGRIRQGQAGFHRYGSISM